jgi:CubicO group peptidase (beta-lactamase class C family)
VQVFKITGTLLLKSHSTSCRKGGYMSNSPGGYALVVLVALTMILPRSSDAEPNLTNGLIKEDFASLQYSFPVAQGWSFEKLSRALLYAREIGSTAVIVLHDGKVVLEWGQTTLRIKSHSVRKSLLSALYGISVEKGFIDLNSTMAELGIDDRPPVLSEEEKQATILDLLKARSGIYHEAAAESENMRRRRPSRGAFAPSEHWYYNNWDFNALGTIFERQTNLTIGQAFKEWIAEPIGMQDFRVEDVHYWWETVSLHPSYPFWISARDLARFGQLYLQMGRWEDQQVIPKSWIEDSIIPYSQTYNEGGYGYMWWIHPSGSYYAEGYMGQFVVIIPELKLVVVNRVFSGTPSMGNLSLEIKDELKQFIKPVNSHEMRRLVDLIIEAQPSP